MKTDDQSRIIFANRLRTLRCMNNMSRKELASRIGVSYTRLTAWELCYYEAHYESLIRIAGVFDVSIDYLLGCKERNAQYIRLMGP